jgi:hypothetical protein
MHHSRARRLVGALALSAACVIAPLTFSACSAGATTTQVPISLIPNGSNGGVSPVVQVQIGDNSAVPLILDTGSIGLHVFVSDISTGPSSGVTLGSTSFTEQFVDGTFYRGTIGSAQITIGGVQTQVAIPIGVVNSVGCIAQKPNCPTRNGVMSSKVDGVMGIGLDAASGNHVVNPLFALPGSAGQSWSLQFEGQSGTLTLGASPGPNATSFSLPSEGSWTVPNANGSPSGVTEQYWNDKSLDVCYTIGSVSDLCQATLFDSGEPTMTVFGGALASQLASMTVPVSSSSTASRLRSGIPVSIGNPVQTPFWSFQSGTRSGVNRVAVVGSAGGTVNGSIGAFFANPISYDVVSGTIWVG